MEITQKLGVTLLIASFLFALLSCFYEDVWERHNQFRFAGVVGAMGAIILVLCGIIDICIK